MPYPFGFLFLAINVEFIAGFALALFMMKRQVPRPLTVMIAGVIGILVFGAIDVYFLSYGWHSNTILVYGIPSVMILAGAIELERAQRIRVPRFMVLLGDASYSIYLVHLPVLLVMGKVAPIATSLAHLPGCVVFILVSGIALAA